MKLRTFLTTIAMLCMALAAAAQGNTIIVNNAAELVNALGSDRTIVIATNQPLNITEAIDQRVGEGTLPEGETYYDPVTAAAITAQVTYASNSDGNTLQIQGFYAADSIRDGSFKEPTDLDKRETRKSAPTALSYDDAEIPFS